MLSQLGSYIRKAPQPMPVSVVSRDEVASARDCSGSIKLLSYNIQVGISSQSLRSHVTNGWQHALPHPRRQDNLKNIARLLKDYDLVALQEVDGGSIRSSHTNQVEYLAHEAGFPYWYQQLNRNLGRLAQHSNGVLSRLKPESIEDHKLPGMVPGRGAILAKFGSPQNPVVVVMLHLSLSPRARRQQLGYVREMVEEYQHVILMGDMNSQVARLLKMTPLAEMGLQVPDEKLNTYPSWRPVYSYDHILVSESLKVKSLEVIPFTLSDHRPVAMEVALPETHLGMN